MERVPASLPTLLAPTRRQVNAKELLREVHAAEEGLEAGVGLSVCVETGDGLVFIGVELKSGQQPMNNQYVMNQPRHID